VNLLYFVEDREDWLFYLSMSASSAISSGIRERPRFHIVVPGKQQQMLGVLSILGCDFYIYQNVVFKPLFPTLNKISAVKCLMEETEDFVLVDHDTLFVDFDMVGRLRGTAFRACTNLKDGIQKSIGGACQVLSVELTGKEWRSIDYINAGFVYFPSNSSKRILEPWYTTVDKIAEVLKDRSSSQPFPIGNLSLSFAIVISEIPFLDLPDKFNQRNWPSLSDAPVMIHFNNFDKENVELKQLAIMHHEEFLSATDRIDTPWWNKYRPHFHGLAWDMVEKIKSDLSPLILR